MNQKSPYREIVAGADYSIGAIILVKLTDKERKLTVGCFYWIKVRVIGTVDAGEWQPGRFTGIDFSHLPTWDFIGEETESGHHHVEVAEVGTVIVRPDVVA